MQIIHFYAYKNRDFLELIFSNFAFDRVFLLKNIIKTTFIHLISTLCLQYYGS